MKFNITVVVLLVIIFSLGDLVSGNCGSSSGLLETPWAACIPSESEEETCPHSFIKLAGNNVGCRGSMTRPDNHPYVCCLLTPLVELKIKDAPCMSSSESTPSSPGTRAVVDVHDKKKSKSH